jgi:cell division protein FtsW
MAEVTAERVNTEQRRRQRLKDFDFSLLTLVLLLMAIGLLMVFSASSYYAMYRFGNKFEFLLKQSVFSVGGVFVMWLTSRVDYHVLGKISPVLAMLGIVLLGLVCIPGIGYEINGARRWFNLGFTTVQPSEFMKLALILVLSFSLSHRQDKLRSLRTGLIPYLIMVGIIDAALYFQHHMSAIVIVTMLAVIILFAAGAKIWHFLLVGIPAGGLLGMLMFMEGYRVDRIMTFFGKSTDPTDDAYQITNSLVAIGSGGLFGKGLGRSLQKNLFIPEPQSDFIYAIFAEELGFVGAVSLLVLFILLIFRGMRIAMNAPDMLGGLMGVGITSLVAIQMLLNVAVVTKTIPTTGIPLPFFSAGGTSLIFLMMAMGILLNISRQTVPLFHVRQQTVERQKGGGRKPAEPPRRGTPKERTRR